MIFGQADKGIDGLLDKTKQIVSYLGTTKNLYNHFEIDFSGLKTKDIKALQNYINLLNEGKSETAAYSQAMRGASHAAKIQTEGLYALNSAYKSGIISEEQYVAATQNLAAAQKNATATTQALGIALNVIKNVGITLIITGITKGISLIVDKLIVTKEELEEVQNRVLESTQSLRNNAEAFFDDAKAIDELVAKYKEISSSTMLSVESKNELVEIQNELIDKFGKEAKGLDLLNGKYDENISKIKEYSAEKYKEWQRQNAADIARAEKIRSYNIKFYNPDEDTYSEDIWRDINYSGYSQQGDTRIISPYELLNSDSLMASLFTIKGEFEDIRDIYKDINGILLHEGIGKDTLMLSGDIEVAIDQLGQLIEAYKSSNFDVNDDSFKLLQDHYNMLIAELENIEYVEKNRREYESENTKEFNDELTSNIAKLKELNAATGDMHSAWFDNFKEMQEGIGSTIDTLSKDLQTLVDGNALSSEDFWKIMELDTNHIITDIKMVGDQFVLNQDQLIALKDQYVQNQIETIELQNKEIENQKTLLITTIAQAEAELSVLGARGMSNEAYRKQFAEAQNAIKQAKANLVELENQQRRNNVLIDQCNSKLGDTADYVNRLKKELEQINNDLDDYVKAYEYRIDRIIDSLQDEVDVLNEQKDAMQEELDVLYEQRDAIQETIDNYKTVADLVQDTIDKRKEELEAEKKAVEDTYNERINKLKEETEQREDAYEYAQKLANLENAKNNKRRVYDEARGWRYESVKEDVVKAENDLKNYENSQAIKALEKERDEVIKTIDEQIEEQDKYAKYYKDTLDEIINQEKELIAEQILGSKWREDIAKLDIETAEKFRTEYRNHNTALQNLVKTEINLKEASIKATDAEIKGKQKQIDSWKKYKTDVTNAVKDVKEAQEGYMSVVRELDETEPLTLENRGRAFDTFKTKVTGAIETITAKQGEVDRLTSSFDGLTGDYGISFSIAGVDQLQQATELAERLAVATSLANGTFHANNISDIVKAMGLGYTDADLVNSWIKELIQGEHAKGGVADYTGLAMLHGTKQKSETIFNANDSAKLYEMVHNTPNLMADMLNQATKLSGFKLSSNENTNNSSVSIGAINVYANNPTELTQGLDKTLDRYFRTKLTQSYTNKQ